VTKVSEIIRYLSNQAIFEEQAMDSEQNKNKSCKQPWDNAIIMCLSQNVRDNAVGDVFYDGCDT